MSPSTNAVVETELSVSLVQEKDKKTTSIIKRVRRPPILTTMVLTNIDRGLMVFLKNSCLTQAACFKMERQAVLEATVQNVFYGNL